MASRRHREIRPGLDIVLEQRRLCASGVLGPAPAAADVASYHAAAPTRPGLLPSTYGRVMSRIDSAFEAYRGRGWGDAINSLWDGLMAAANGAGQSPTDPLETSLSDPAREKGNTMLLLGRVSDAVARLPYGGQIWTAIRLDPSSITTANSTHVRDRIKREVRVALRQEIAEGRVELIRPPTWRTPGRVSS